MVGIQVTGRDAELGEQRRPVAPEVVYEAIDAPNRGGPDLRLHPPTVSPSGQASWPTATAPSPCTTGSAPGPGPGSMSRGDLHHRHTDERQIWIAAGIGIMPFLSSVRSLVEAPLSRRDRRGGRSVPLAAPAPGRLRAGRAPHGATCSRRGRRRTARLGVPLRAARPGPHLHPGSHSPGSHRVRTSRGLLAQVRAGRTKVPVSWPVDVALARPVAQLPRRRPVLASVLAAAP